MVMSTTLRLSAHPAVDVVIRSVVVAAGSPHRSTLRQNALTSGTDGPLMTLKPCPPLYGTSGSAVPWMCMTDVGCGDRHGSSCVAASGPIAAKTPVLHAR